MANLETYKSKIFYELYFGFLIVAGVILCSFSKFEIHFGINSIHSRFFDESFMSITHIGEGVFAVLVSLLLLFYSIRFCLMFVSTSILVGLVVGFFKRVVFYGEPRPITVLKEFTQLYIIPGFEPNEINSFPSGHSALIFAMVISISFLVQKNWIRILLFVIAIIVCYSRLYLSEHFLIDVTAGATIGVLIASVVGFVFEKYAHSISNNSVVYRFL